MLRKKSFILLSALLGHIIIPTILHSRQTSAKQPTQQSAPSRRRPAQRQIRAKRPVKRQPRSSSRRAQQRSQQTTPLIAQQAQPQIAPQQPVALPVPPPILPVQPVVQQNISTQSRLSDFDFNSASVIPLFINKNGIKYLILGREAHGNSKGTYDDFGGARDLVGPQNNQRREPHPVITAAREFFEEAILMLSINFSVEKIQDFIDLKNTHTECVIACERNVTYITDFTSYAGTFFANFYTALATTTSHHSQEKDRIAIVEWDVLKTAVNNNISNTGLVVDALVLNPLDQNWSGEKITLRGFFVKKLRPFWMDKPYQEGLNPKIHFY